MPSFRSYAAFLRKLLFETLVMVISEKRTPNLFRVFVNRSDLEKEREIRESESFSNLSTPANSRFNLIRILSVISFAISSGVKLKTLVWYNFSSKERVLFFTASSRFCSYSFSVIFLVCPNPNMKIFQIFTEYYQSTQYIESSG